MEGYEIRETNPSWHSCILNIIQVIFLLVVVYGGEQTLCEILGTDGSLLISFETMKLVDLREKLTS